MHPHPVFRNKRVVLYYRVKTTKVVSLSKIVHICESLLRTAEGKRRDSDVSVEEVKNFPVHTSIVSLHFYKAADFVYFYSFSFLR